MKRKYQIQAIVSTKRFISTSIVLGSILLLAFTSCKKDDNSSDPELIGDWMKLSYFEGQPRSEAVGFLIDNKIYLGLGYLGSGSDTLNDRPRDFWQFDTDKNQWTRVANFPGAGRNGAVAFSAGGKGYVGLGYTGYDKLNDFWEYNPTTDSWRKVASFDGGARYGAVAFSINDKGYVGTGYDGYYKKDLYEFDPVATDTGKWTIKASLTGNKRRDAVAFVINGKGYICGGINGATYEYDFYEYDPTSDSWTEKNDIANTSDETFDDDYLSIKGINKVAFVINGKGYVTTGGEGTVSGIIWEYDPITDLWIQKTTLEGSARSDAFGFAVGNRGYVTTGRSGSIYFDDIWGFDPNNEYNDNN